MSDVLNRAVEWIKYKNEDIDLDIKEAEGDYKQFLIGQESALNEFLSAIEAIIEGDKRKNFTEIKKDQDNKCEYCDKDNVEDDIRGSDGVVYNAAEDKYYLYIEHFRNERNWVEVNYCPECGVKLQMEDE